MAANFGEIVRQARMQRGWDQAELARRLGLVRQQAVSRWENGASRPRRAMVAQLADLLDLDVDVLLPAAGYLGAIADKPAEAGLPVRPLLEKLPFDELSPDDFEQFSTDLAKALHPRASSVSRNGAQGSRQDGVDVIIRYGDARPDGIQCKREKQFGPTKIAKAVGELHMKVGRCFIYLSRVATADARKEIAKHSRWELLDAKDLSSAVRNLKDRDAALRLVDTYFPGYREPFLGVRAPGPWLTCDEFFRSASSDRIYTHRWQLVGRSEQLAGLLAFTASDESQFAVLIGRGGIGKSRLLRELALTGEREGASTFRFAARNTEIGPADFEQLPPGEGLVVVVDDVSEGPEVISLIYGMQRARPDAKIIVSMRPQQLAALTASLGQAGIHPSELARCDMDDLSYVDAEALAGQALGPDVNPALAGRLAGVGRDCPLLIVVGAALIRRGMLDPARLESDDPLRSEIMVAFRKALTGDPAEGDPETRQEILKGIAAFQPFRLDQPAFRSALAGLTGRAFDQLMPHLRHLEDAGVLTRRGTAIRIIPDLLGDAVLAEACLDLRSGTSTGYLERVLGGVEGECLLNVFVNASRVDWQFRNISGSLTASLWETVTREFQAGGNETRLGLLTVLRKVAYFQPGQTIALARWTIANPAEDAEEAAGPWHYQATHRMVLEELAAVLGNAAYHAGHLREAAELLWALARHDTRPLNRYPEHPVRILQSLAEYSPGKPWEFYEVPIAAAQDWLRDPEVAEWPCSPFEVLSPMLATEIMDRVPDTLALRLRTYAVNAEAVRGVRGRVLDLAFAEARNPDPKRAVKAIEAIGNSLRYPAGMLDRSVSPEERAAWTPLFEETISRLGEFAAGEAVDPAVVVAIRAALWWHAQYSETATRTAAQAAWAHLPETAAYNLALVLHDGWGHFLPRGSNFTETKSLREQKLQEAADQAIAAWSDTELADQLEERLAVERLVFGGKSGDAGPFVWTLTGARPSVAEEICRRVAERPQSVLRDLFRMALSRLASMSADTALLQARDLLATHDTVVACYVADAYGLSLEERDTLLGEEADLLRSLAMHDDPQVRRFTVIASFRLARRHRALAVELVTSVRFGDSADVAEDVAGAFGQHGFLSWADFAPGLARHFLDQLRECPSIDGYQVGVLLAEIAKSDASELLTLLMERVELAESREGSLDGYDPLPHTWHVPLPFRSDARYAGLLRTVLDWMSAGIESFVHRMVGAEIFAAVAGDFDAQVTAVLLESVESGQRERVMAAAAVLRHAPAALAWNTDFVIRAMRAAAWYDEECLQAVSTGLQAAVVDGATPSRSPAPDGNGDKAAAIAASMPPGSIEQKFYQSLKETQGKLADMWGSARDNLADHRNW
jgi:transcriptional regulator with XRE-family HTH domain